MFKLCNLILLLAISSTLAYDDTKCSACRAVAAELSLRLSNERPRNHLDVRHRLDKDGKRYGKVIDFKISELRAIELMDDLCNTSMDKYQLSGEYWVLSDLALAEEEENNRHLITEQRRLLRNQCADIIGKWEDDIAAAIKEGKADSENIDEVLCMQYGKYCPWLEDEEKLKAREEL